MDSNEATFVLLCTGWGSKFGGANSLNYQLFNALIKWHRGLTICLILDRDNDEQSPSTNRVFVSKGAECDSPSQLRTLLPEDIFVKNAPVVVWVGHDVHTGEVAIDLAETFGGTSLVFHHMDYESYSFRKLGSTADASLQKEILRKADLVAGVGEKLRKSASEKTQKPEKVLFFIPGLCDLSAPTVYPATLKILISGRLDKDDEPIKQSRLAASAIGRFVSKNFSESYCKDLKVFFKGCHPGRLDKTQEEFEKLIWEQAGHSVKVNVLPFDEDHDASLCDLANYSVCLVPSQHEGFGLVAWEAIAACLPVILTKNSGVYGTIEVQHETFLNLLIGVDLRGSSQSGQFDEIDLDALADALKCFAEQQEKCIKNAKTLKSCLTASSRLTWQSAIEDLTTFVRAHIATSTDALKAEGNSGSDLSSGDAPSTQDYVAAAGASPIPLLTVELTGVELSNRQRLISEIGKVVDRNLCEDLLKRTAQAIYELGDVADLRLNYEVQDEGLKVTIAALENPVIKDIIVVGNRQVGTKDILDSISNKTGQVINTKALRTDIERVNALYRVTGRAGGSAAVHAIQFNEGILQIQVRELAFTSIKLAEHSEGIWEERLSLKNPMGIGPFDDPCEQFFELWDIRAYADPVFDILIRNDSSANLVLLGVGARVIQVASYMFAYGDSKPSKIHVKESISISLPDIRGPLRSQKVDLRLVSPITVNETCYEAFAEPYLLTSDETFRYTLRLADYFNKITNLCTICLLVNSDKGEFESHRVYLRGL